jgi:hypothetical protein
MINNSKLLGRCCTREEKFVKHLRIEPSYGIKKISEGGIWVCWWLFN